VRRRTPDPSDEEGDPATPQAKGAASPGSIVQGAPLKPIRFVERELTRPDGTTLRVKVPVYPPFRLEDRSAAASAPEVRQRPPAQQKKAS
jgi:hypothetical protein